MPAGLSIFASPALERRRPRRAQRALKPLCKWVVPAGVEHHDAQVLRLLQVRHQVLHLCHAAEVGLVLKLGIDRDKIVAPQMLQRMAAIVEQGYVRIARGARKAYR